MKSFVLLARSAMLWIGLAAGSGAAFAAALPFIWEQVTLPASSGASCGNGTPYRFYVNRSIQWGTKKVLVALEPGGACWDYGSCRGDGVLGAANPEGIPDGYLNIVNNWQFNVSGLKMALLSPIMSRVPLQALSSTGKVPQTKDWHYVFLPYCTGDIHGGSAVRSYTDPHGNATRVQEFAGKANVTAAMQWMVKNGLGQPDQLLVWGASAGGYGASLHYASVRSTLQPARSALFNDSGTIFPASLGGNASPSGRAHRMYAKAFNEWGYLQPGGTVDQLAQLPHLDAAQKARLRDNPATLYEVLATAYPRDRMGLATFQRDKTIAQFTYDQFYPEIAQAPNDAARQALRQDMFSSDLGLLVNQLKGSHPNFGYYMPVERNGILDDHTVSTITFLGSEIQINGREQNVGVFVDDLLSGKDPGTQPVMQEYSNGAQRSYLAQLALYVIAGVMKMFN